MHFTIPDEVGGVIAKFEKAGFEIYIVGGAVRDLLMGKSVIDWDFATNATPDESQKVLGKDSYHQGFGTVGLPTQTEGFKPFEITTYRIEFGYSDKRRPDKVAWGKTLEEDLKRRDFTINAMGLTKVKIIDPHGGQKDLEKKLIRAVGGPQERFAEDTLRMMRAVRLAAELNFKIEKKTLDAIKANSTLINKIARERIRDELIKILASPNPHEGVLHLRETGLLIEILPELEKAFGVEQKSPQRHHIYDVGTHCLLSLKHCQSTDPIVRFATLIHDIGKPQTYKKMPNGVITFYNHEVVGTRIAKRIAERLRFSNEQARKLIKLVRWHQFSVGETQTDKALRRFITRVGVENVEDMLELRRADRLGSGARETSWRTEEFKKRLIEVQKQPFTIHDLKITGNDVMKVLGIKPGPKIGEILEKLFAEVVDQKLPNDKKAQLTRLKELE
ncbi:hypothetical protein A2630_00825 [Candidatus Woesebacteria bacterium RIFCSPHIGHO2_01_FULL_44_10]|uniref:HD domain-containing protein n=1 Tax=Candidatus Woesebacteria bacterium RIFCSPLOWO2_01_FULL_44_14 TaxID=1802525 RepID=A0A1F8C1M6_9BACT|nr:MAG: hypothetical protein A2630_00825 [Candidatus Woesebacteria bacterium RIFCSPHIGHO2_01_FULL_44_10]OGM54336.1 MAG: hypothetical protein A3F62_01105 [Candidatus Woesebacteria bacterium RIFCSPHIGHO2_12_FULL_44_11]OGM70237.1 MAG: hypothetical protein A2975_04155 [Candidatus Woesebacteria bacterium RIFCSPLOWO2_01_FULL_44_14]